MADTMFDPDDEVDPISGIKRPPRVAMIAAPTPVKPGLDLPGIGPAIPSGVAPITPAKDAGQLGADKTELARLESTGSGVSQLQRKHPVLGTLGRIADVIGSIVAPGAAAQIPGTTAHHSLLVNKERGQIKGDIANMEGEAQAQQEQAKAQSLINPPAKEKPAGSTVETGDGVYQWNPETNKYDTKVGPPKTLPHALNDPKAGYAQAISDAITNGRDPNNDPHVIAWKQAMDNIAKQEKPDSPEQQFLDEYHHDHPGSSVGEGIHAYGAASQRPPVVNVNQQSARSDKSYQYNSGVLDKVGSPIEQAVQRMGRLRDTLAQGSPQADALVAPELLTVMAGGTGSGLRMNEAEISRIVGGRSNWETLKASVNKWSLDPAQANSITPDQRQQIHALVEHVNQKLIAKQKLLDDARNSLLDSDDPKVHRGIVNKARQAMTQIDEGVEPGGNQNQASEPQPPKAPDQGMKWQHREANGQIEWRQVRQ